MTSLKTTKEKTKKEGETMKTITAKTLTLGLVVTAISIGFVPILHAAPAPKVTICHIPPDNPAGAHDITISENAVPAHMEHGDFSGTCDNLPAPEVCVVGETSCCPNGTCGVDPICDDSLASCNGELATCQGELCEEPLQSCFADLDQCVGLEECIDPATCTGGGCELGVPGTNCTDISHCTDPGETCGASGCCSVPTTCPCFDANLVDLITSAETHDFPVDKRELCNVSTTRHSGKDSGGHYLRHVSNPPEDQPTCTVWQPTRPGDVGTIIPPLKETVFILDSSALDDCFANLVAAGCAVTGDWP